MLKTLYTALAAVICVISIPSYADTLPEKEISCIALAIQKEAGNQSIQGMTAVGHVIINRTKSPKYPHTPCKVVYQKTGSHCQFSWACHKLNNTKISELAFNSAKISIKELDNTKGSVAFHIKSVHPAWNNLHKTVSIGQHVFFASN